MPYKHWNYDDIEPIEVPLPEVMRAGIKHAEEHIEAWNQAAWCDIRDLTEDGQPTCGTTACLAGHILLSQGHTWQEIESMNISREALKALGWRWNIVFELEDANCFEDLVFTTITDGYGDHIAYTREKLDEFKEHITKLTGITFEEEDHA